MCHLHNRCNLCLCEDNNLIPAAQNKAYDALVGILKFVVPEMILYGPVSVCYSCLVMLTSYSTFKKKCLENNYYMSNYVNMVKKVHNNQNTTTYNKPTEEDNDVEIVAVTSVSPNEARQIARNQKTTHPPPSTGTEQRYCTEGNVNGQTNFLPSNNVQTNQQVAVSSRVKNVHNNQNTTTYNKPTEGDNDVEIIGVTSVSQNEARQIARNLKTTHPPPSTGTEQRYCTEGNVNGQANFLPLNNVQTKQQVAAITRIQNPAVQSDINCHNKQVEPVRASSGQVSFDNNSKWEFCPKLKNSNNGVRTNSQNSSKTTTSGYVPQNTVKDRQPRNEQRSKEIRTSGLVVESEPIFSTSGAANPNLPEQSLPKNAFNNIDSHAQVQSNSNIVINNYNNKQPRKEPKSNETRSAANASNFPSQVISEGNVYQNTVMDNHKSGPSRQESRGFGLILECEPNLYASGAVKSNLLLEQRSLKHLFRNIDSHTEVQSNYGQPRSNEIINAGNAPSVPITSVDNFYHNAVINNFNDEQSRKESRSKETRRNRSILENTLVTSIGKFHQNTLINSYNNRQPDRNGYNKQVESVRASSEQVSFDNNSKRKSCPKLINSNNEVTTNSHNSSKTITSRYFPQNTVKDRQPRNEQRSKEIRTSGLVVGSEANFSTTEASNPNLPEQRLPKIAFNNNDSHAQVHSNSNIVIHSYSNGQPRKETESNETRSVTNASKFPSQVISERNVYQNTVMDNHKNGPSRQESRSNETRSFGSILERGPNLYASGAVNSNLLPEQRSQKHSFGNIDSHNEVQSHGNIYHNSVINNYGQPRSNEIINAGNAPSVPVTSADNFYHNAVINGCNDKQSIKEPPSKEIRRTRSVLENTSDGTFYHNKVINNYHNRQPRRNDITNNATDLRNIPTFPAPVTSEFNLYHNTIQYSHSNAQSNIENASKCAIAGPSTGNLYHNTVLYNNEQSRRKLTNNQINNTENTLNNLVINNYNDGNPRKKSKINETRIPEGVLRNAANSPTSVTSSGNLYENTIINSYNYGQPRYNETRNTGPILGNVTGSETSEINFYSNTLMNSSNDGQLREELRSNVTRNAGNAPTFSCPVTSESNVCNDTVITSYNNDQPRKEFKNNMKRKYETILTNTSETEHMNLHSEEHIRENSFNPFNNHEASSLFDSCNNRQSTRQMKQNAETMSTKAETESSISVPRECFITDAIGVLLNMETSFHQPINSNQNSNNETEKSKSNETPDTKISSNGCQPSFEDLLSVSEEHLQPKNVFEGDIDVKEDCVPFDYNVERKLYDHLVQSSYKDELTKQSKNTETIIKKDIVFSIQENEGLVLAAEESTVKITFKEDCVVSQEAVISKVTNKTLTSFEDLLNLNEEQHKPKIVVHDDIYVKENSVPFYSAEKKLYHQLVNSYNNEELTQKLKVNETTSTRVIFQKCAKSQFDLSVLLPKEEQADKKSLAEDNCEDDKTNLKNEFTNSKSEHLISNEEQIQKASYDDDVDVKENSLPFDNAERKLYHKLIKNEELTQKLKVNETTSTIDIFQKCAKSQFDLSVLLSKEEQADKKSLAENNCEDDKTNLKDEFTNSKSEHLISNEEQIQKASYDDDVDVKENSLPFDNAERKLYHKLIKNEELTQKLKVNETTRTIDIFQKCAKSQFDLSVLLSKQGQADKKSLAENNCEDDKTNLKHEFTNSKSEHLISNEEQIQKASYDDDVDVKENSLPFDNAERKLYHKLIKNEELTQKLKVNETTSTIDIFQKFAKLQFDLSVLLPKEEQADKKPFAENNCEHNKTNLKDEFPNSMSEHVISNEEHIQKPSNDDDVDVKENLVPHNRTDRKFYNELLTNEQVSKSTNAIVLKYSNQIPSQEDQIRNESLRDKEDKQQTSIKTIEEQVIENNFKGSTITFEDHREERHNFQGEVDTEKEFVLIDFTADISQIREKITKQQNIETDESIRFTSGLETSPQEDAGKNEEKSKQKYNESTISENIENEEKQEHQNSVKEDIDIKDNFVPFYNDANTKCYYELTRASNCESKISDVESTSNSLNDNNQKKAISTIVNNELCKCDVCGKKILRAAVPRHKRKHTYLEDYECKICNQLFRRKQLLEKHMIKHNKFNFPCTLCRRAYICESDLLEHKKCHTTENNCEDDKTKFKNDFPYSKSELEISNDEHIQNKTLTTFEDSLSLNEEQHKPINVAQDDIDLKENCVPFDSAERKLYHQLVNNEELTQKVKVNETTSTRDIFQKCAKSQFDLSVLLPKEEQTDIKAFAENNCENDKTNLKVEFPYSKSELVISNEEHIKKASYDDDVDVKENLVPHNRTDRKFYNELLTNDQVSKSTNQISSEEDQIRNESLRDKEDKQQTNIKTNKEQVIENNFKGFTTTFEDHREERHNFPTDEEFVSIDFTTDISQTQQTITKEQNTETDELIRFTSGLGTLPQEDPEKNEEKSTQKYNESTISKNIEDEGKQVHPNSLNEDNNINDNGVPLYYDANLKLYYVLTNCESKTSNVESTSNSLNDNNQRNEVSKKVYNELCKCDICGKNILKSSTTQHMKMHASNVECTICGQLCKGKDVLEKHMRKHNKFNFQCTLCKRAYKYESGLLEHKKHHTEAKNFACTICTKKFYTARSLQLHKIHNHDKDKTFECSICDRKFFIKVHLELHEKKHARIYECNVCHKNFKRAVNLSQHMKIHNGIKKWKCSICNRAFLHNTHLKQHLKTHSRVNKEFQCSVCSKYFSNNGVLRKHMEIHSKQLLIKDDDITRRKTRKKK